MIVDEKCLIGGGLWDDGSYQKPGEHPAACARSTRSGCHIWIQNNEIGAKALPHELAHCDGHADPEEDGYDW
jgi:hypothetical protein